MQRARHTYKHTSPSTLSNSVNHPQAREFEDEPPFCFRCKELFADRMWLEEHLCPAMTFICSCGSEFSVYMDMFQHSREHEPGASTLHHAAMQKRRFEMQKKAKEQLRWSMQTPIQQRYQMPATRVDLWALYQPVVLLETLRSFDKGKPYQCANCEQGFTKRNELIRHHSAHIRERVVGCLQCGMLLPTSSNRSKLHVCHSSTTLMDRITTVQKATTASAPKVTITAAPKAQVTTAHTVLNNMNPVLYKNNIVLPKVAQAHALLKHQVCKNAADRPSGMEGLKCGLCLIQFHSISLLQRHKCAVAADYIQRQVLMPTNHKRVSPYGFPQNNVDRKLKVNIQASRDVQAYHHKTVVPDRAVEVPATIVNKEVDSDDDCYVIE